MTDAVITPLQARIDEVAQYETNIAMYKVMLAALPTEWPTRLLQYKDVTNKHEVIGKIQDLDDVELLSDLWAADDCVRAIRTETLEKRKSEAILVALKATK
jgi:hypothetical protein